MKILFLIGSLRTGGAERQFSLLAQGLANRGHLVTFATLRAGGQYWDDLQKDERINLISLTTRLRERRSQAYDVIQAARSLRKIIDDHKPDVLYSGLIHTNALAALVAKRTRTIIVWGLRQSALPSGNKIGLIFRMLKALAPRVDLAISNSFAGIDFHKRMGLLPKQWAVVNNGIDTDYFAPSADARARGRALLSLDDNVTTIGMVGRVNPVKRHELFLQAIAKALEMQESVREARFVIVGRAAEERLAELQTITEDLGIDKMIVWQGEQTDLQAIYNAFDVHVSCSASEGFSNVVAESMACGTANIVSDVGDSARIVGETGRVVESSRPRDFAAAIIECMNDPNIGNRCNLCSMRIHTEFRIDRALDRTEECLSQLISGHEG